MKNLMTTVVLTCILLVGCNKDDKNTTGSDRNEVSLLVATSYSTNPNYTFEYDSEHRLVKCITNGGVEVKEYRYDAEGDFTGFTETTQSNAIYGKREYVVEVNTPSEISGKFYLYDVNDNIDSTQTSEIIYELDGGLIKKYSHQYENSLPWEKSFEHNAAGDLTAIQLFEDPEPFHLYRLEFSEWDDKSNTNIFASALQTYPAMDIIPGIRLSNHNVVNRLGLLSGVDNTGVSPTGRYYYEYNDYDQVTRIYTLTEDAYDEEGKIVVQGGEEVELATFNYMVVEQ